MAAKWFVQRNENVEGPLTTEDVNSRFRSGQLAANHLIWGPGLEHWHSLSWWTNEIQQATSAVASGQRVAAATEFASPVAETVFEGGTQDMETRVDARPVDDATAIFSLVRDDEATIIEMTPQEVWHFAHDGKSFGPFKRDALIEELKKVDSLGEVLLWTKGMKEWAPLFEFHDVLTALGVNKRIFPRADVQGKVTIKSDGATLVAPLLTISEGGFGIQLDTGLVPGQSVSVELHAGVFRQPILARAECRYASTGVMGMRFTNINSESKASIIQFVKQSQTRFVLKAS